ncbi:unnamed protein product [Prunus armeniaca]
MNLHPMTTRSKSGISKRKRAYRIKKHADGSIAWHKNCLVAKGFSQDEGIDYSKIFSTVVKPTTIQLVLALAAQFNWSLRQLDVKNALRASIIPLNLLLKDDGKPYSHPAQYRSIVEILQYLTFTRPDIAFSVNQACQFMLIPWNLMLWRLRES